MNYIGIRVSPKTIFFSVIEYDDDLNEVDIITVDKVIIPVSMDIPDQLSFIRTTMFSIIKEYKINSAGLRRMEDNLPSKKLAPIISRAYIEGVIQELISNCTVDRYFSGKIAKISSLLKQQTKDIKNCIDGSDNIFDFDDWGKYKLEERESILCAIAAIYL